MATHTHDHHHFEWCVVFAGTVLAVALSIVLMQFGSAIGLSSDRLLEGNADITHWAVLAIGIWIFAVQLTASSAGGYVGGLLRSPCPELTPHENEMRDGLYGLSVWATSTIIVFTALAVGASVAAFIDVQTPAVELTPELADQEQKIAIIFAFIMGATSLVSAAVAWAAATAGGHHRDQKTDLSHYITFKGR